MYVPFFSLILLLPLFYFYLPFSASTSSVLPLPHQFYLYQFQFYHLPHSHPHPRYGTFQFQQRSGAALFQSRNCFESSIPSVNRRPIRYTFCDAPFHCPVQCEHSLKHSCIIAYKLISCVEQAFLWENLLSAL